MTITATLYDHDLFTTPERPGMLFRREVGGGVEYCDKAEYDYMADKLAADYPGKNIYPGHHVRFYHHAIFKDLTFTGNIATIE
tara:strand:- start:46 stop:294 length:249 start_codon:yes stop_codon:yes gene_type:complete